MPSVREFLAVPQSSPGDRTEEFSKVRDIIRQSYTNVVLVLQGGGALGSISPAWWR